MYFFPNAMIFFSLSFSFFCQKLKTFLMVNMLKWSLYFSVQKQNTLKNKKNLPNFLHLRTTATTLTRAPFLYFHKKIKLYLLLGNAFVNFCIKP